MQSNSTTTNKQLYEALSFLVFFAILSGCTVWQSDRSNAKQYDRNGRASEMDQTRVRDGQPYYLPKGMVHLMIKGGAAGDPPKEEEPKEEAKNKATGATETKDEVDPETGNLKMPSKPSNEQSVQGGADAAGNQGQVKSYQVSASVVFEADATAGVFYAHYNPNWFFDDLAAIQVNNKRLLHTVTSITEDQTLAIVNNLTDTVTNSVSAAAKFAAMGAREDWAGEVRKSAPQRMRKIHIKTLNIDERFDPLNARDRARIEALFSDYEEGKHYLVLSPFKIEFRFPESPRGVMPTPQKLERSGLWFREPQQVEIVLKSNPKVLTHARAALSVVCDQIDDLEAVREKAEVKSTTPGVSAEDAAIAKAQKPTTDAALAELVKVRDELQQIYFKSQPGASATLGSFSLVVASKDYPYTIGIKRSAFVKRSTEVQITDGVLMGVGHNKPSEILGFTKIPLSVSEKILALPKAILTGKKEVLTEKNAMLKQQSGGGD